jgi:hypothetical protein
MSGTRGLGAAKSDIDILKKKCSHKVRAEADALVLAIVVIFSITIRSRSHTDSI